MENLKIVIGKNKDIANQAKDLLLELGLYVSSEKRHNFYGWVARASSGDYINDIYDFDRDKAKLVTIQDLKDMVILKRNDPNDATHEDECGLYLKCYNGTTYHWFCGQWGRLISYNGDLKPIKKVKIMGEYLFKFNDQYTLVELSKEDAESNPEQYIEVPDGAQYMTMPNYYFWRDHELCAFSKILERWSGNSGETMQDYLNQSASAKIVWSRDKESTMQEQLDYADELRSMGESGWSKEKHSHYKKDVSHLKHIDVYRVLEIYGVESHAVGHAIKKLLCSGQRGLKDRNQDIQEAIDSLNRELEMVKEDEI